MTTSPTRSLAEWIDLAVGLSGRADFPESDDFILASTLLQELADRGDAVPATTRATVCGVAAALIRRAGQTPVFLEEARRKLAAAMHGTQH